METKSVLFDVNKPSVPLSSGEAIFTAANIERFIFSDANAYRYFRVTVVRVGAINQDYVVVGVNTGDQIDSVNKLSHDINDPDTLNSVVVANYVQTQTRRSDVNITGIDVACVGTDTGVADKGFLVTVEAW